MARYEAGETLASIARTYDCSAPAISYIVSRNRDKPTGEALLQGAAEPQLIKALPAETAAVLDQPMVAVAAAAPAATLRREAAPERRALARDEREHDASALFQRNGSAERPNAAFGVANVPPPRPAAPPQGTAEARPRLHLSLGNGSANGNGPQANSGASNGNGHAPETQRNGGRPVYPQPASRPPHQPEAAERSAPPSFQGLPRGSTPLDQGRSDRDLFSMEGRPASQLPREDGEPARRKDNGAYIDQELRTRVDGDIAVFLAAFDAALAADTEESRFGLREATDRLLRAGARTRIELERLEARVPLAKRDAGAAETPAWRHR